MTAHRSFPGAARLAAALLCLTALLPGFTAARASGAPGVAEPVQRTLGNGLRVAVFPSSRVGLVQIQLLVPAGVTTEPAGLEGIAAVTAEMLEHGTTSRDPAAFADEIERMGGSISPTVSQDFASLSSTFLSRDFEAAMELMSDGVIYPIFNPDEVQRVKSDVLRQLAAGRQNSRSSADDQVAKLVFQDHPYGRSTWGTWDAVAGLDAARVRSFWSDRWRPDRAVIAIAGDVTPERAFAVAEEWFGRWSGRGEAPPQRRSCPALDRVRIRIVDQPVTLAELRIGAPAPARGAADETAAHVASALAAGSPTGRSLMGHELRTSVSALADGGMFVMGVSVPAESVGAAASQIVARLAALQQPAAEGDLARTQKQMKNALPMSLESLGALTAAWLAADFYGGATPYFDGYAERIDALSAASVAEAAKRWLDPTRVAIVAVGPAAQLQPQLEPFGTVEVIAPESPATSPPPPAQPAPVTAPTGAQIAQGRDLMRKALAAHGGLVKLRAIRDSRVEASVTLNLSAQKIEGDLVQVRREPDRMEYTTTIGGMVTHQVLVGHQAWQYSGTDSGAVDADSMTVAALRSGFSSDFHHLLLAAADPKALTFASGREKIGDVNAWAVVVRPPAQGPRTLYVHPVNYHVIAFDQGERDESGGALARRTFSDFRPVGGILWPHIEKRLLNGETVMEVFFQTVRFNTGVPDSAFRKPIRRSEKAR